MRQLLRLLTLALAVGIAAPAFAEDPKPAAPKPTVKKVENPLYASWAKWKPGAWVRHASATEMPGNTMKQVTTQKLLEVTEEKVVIEMKMAMEVAGQKTDMPATKMDVSRWIEEVQTPVLQPEKKPETKTGEEKVTVGDKSYACKTAESTMETSGTKVWTKTWMCSDVPGGTVKMEMKSESGETKTAITSTLEAWGEK